MILPATLSSSKEYRIRRYQFSIALFCDMFITGSELAVRVKQGWPKDARIVGLHSDEATYSFTVLVQSEEFEEVKIKDHIPAGEVHLEDIK